MTDDNELLRRYAEEKSEEAFAELVRRHVDFVYAAALRQARGSAALAQDVTQVVFTDLARKAAALSRHEVVVGWLHTATRFAAGKAMRTESRRHAREHEAHAMNEVLHESVAPVDWERLQPVLDAVLGELKERERAAILLRFFEKKPLAEVGAALSLSEMAARSCVDRALDKMHALLARRGITSTATALGLALGNQASVAAPTGLAASVAGAALAGITTVTAGALGGGVLAFMSTGKIVLGLAGVVAIAGFSAAFVAAGTAREAEAALVMATAQQAALNAKLTELETRVQTETRRVQQAEFENARLLTAAQAMKVAPAAAVASAPEVITSEIVSARFKRAQELARTGDPAEALRELLWCYDVGMARIGSFVGVRFSYALDSLVALAERHPPARAALLERQEKARKTMLADERDFDAAMAFGAISRVLKDGGATVAMLDQLPPGDSRRGPLATNAYDDLVAARRYALAMEGRPYAEVSSMLEREIGRSNRTPEIAEYAKSIEVFAGAGDLAHARALADRLLALDGSEATRALLQKYATRAGHPELLAAPAR